MVDGISIRPGGRQSLPIRAPDTTVQPALVDKSAAAWYDALEVMDMAKQDKRFVKVFEQGVLENFSIWADRETGVQYLRSCAGDSGSITLLVGADGKPLLAEQPIVDWEEQKKLQKQKEKSDRHPWG